MSEETQTILMVLATSNHMFMKHFINQSQLALLWDAIKHLFLTVLISLDFIMMSEEILTILMVLATSNHIITRLFHRKYQFQLAHL